MKSVSKNGKQSIATLFFMLVMLVSNFSATGYDDFTCPTPTSVTKTSHTSTGASFSWQGSGTYSVWYVRQEDSSVGTAVTPSGNSVTFTSMACGTYTIHALTTCPGGDVHTVIFDDLIIC